MATHGNACIVNSAFVFQQTLVVKPGWAPRGVHVLDPWGVKLLSKWIAWSKISRTCHSSQIVCLPAQKGVTDSFLCANWIFVSRYCDQQNIELHCMVQLWWRWGGSKFFVTVRLWWRVYLNTNNPSIYNRSSIATYNCLMPEVRPPLPL